MSTAVYAAENAWLTLQAGFTTVQSLGAPVDAVVRDRVNQGLLPGPRILTSMRQLNERTGDADAFRAAVRQLKSDGADVVKLFATTGLLSGGKASLSEAQLNAACGRSKGGWPAHRRSCDWSRRRPARRTGRMYGDRAWRLPR